MKQQIFVVGLLSIMVIGFSISGLPQATADEVLKMGCLTAYTGAYAMWDIPIARSLELMAEKINKEGGIRVKNVKYQIELIKSDYKTSPEVALAQANRLIFHDKVNYIAGPGISSATLAVQPVTEKSKVVLMSYSFTPKILGQDKPYTFRLYSAGSENILGLLMYLTQNRPETKNVALLGPNDETGWGTSAFAKAKSEENGMKIVFEDFVQRGTTDFFPVLTKMLPKNVHVLIIHSIPPADAGILLQQAYQMGYKGLILSPSYYDPKMLVTKAGLEATEGFVFCAKDFTGPLATPMMREFHKNYMEKYKEEFNPIANMGYPTLYVLRMAIERAGSLETSLVAKTLESIEGEHPWGKFTMGGLKTYGARHQIVEPIWIATIKQGELSTLGFVMPLVP